MAETDYDTDPDTTPLEPVTPNAAESAPEEAEVAAGPPPDSRRGLRVSGWIALACLMSLVSGGLGGVVGANIANRDETSSVDAASPAPLAADPRTDDGSDPEPGDGTTTETTPEDLRDLVARVERSVVNINVGGGEGTGIVLTADGEVLTNAHVVAGGSGRNIAVAIPGDNQARRASVVDVDESSDLALLKVADVSGLTVAELGNSSELRVGEDVVAIGNALGLRGDPSVTRGIVSGLSRSIGDLTGLIQTDAAINPGNSGGPLVNSRGQVVGINTAIRGGAQNIGFAIPVDTAKAFVDRVRKGEPAPTQAYLGISTSVPEDGNPGAEVVQVEPGSAAERAGVEPGDRIVGIDGKPVPGPAELGGLIRSHEPGDSIEVRLVRDGQERTVKVTLGERRSA